MKELHICPKCDEAKGWHGPPYTGRFSKLKAILFRIWNHKPPFVRCSNCGTVVTFDTWTNLKRKMESY